MTPEPSLPAEDPIAVPPATPSPPRPWGFWATIGFSVAIAIAFVIVQGVTVALFLSGAFFHHEPAPSKDLGADGALLAITTLCGAPVILTLCAFVAWLRRGITVKEYLALRWPSVRVVTRGIIFVLLYAVASDALTALQGKPIVPEFMVKAYESAGSLMPYLWLALLLGAPLGEEFFFRGFLFVGLRQSPLRAPGAIFITAALWAAIHLQYDLYGILTVFTLGILLGLARHKSDSLLLCVLMHSVANLIATCEVAYYSSMLQE